MDDKVLKHINLCQLDLALEVRRICDKHHLIYFLAGGTLRGAALFGGFLPGDEDIDIGMPRESYDKFLAVCEDELDDSYFLQNFYTEQNYGYTYSKLRIKNTEFLEQDSADVNINHGIFIDVYPFDAEPESAIKRKIQLLIYKILKTMQLLKNGYTFTGKSRVIVWLIAFLAKPFRKDWLYECSENNIQRYNPRDSKYLVALDGGHGYRERISIDELNDRIKIRFEECEFTSLASYDVLLKRIYGEDYKCYQRKDNSHNIVRINYSNYTVKGKEYYDK